LTAALRELVPFHTLMFEVKKFVNRSWWFCPTS
jgi:hypothetical protein